MPSVSGSRTRVFNSVPSSLQEPHFIKHIEDADAAAASPSPSPSHLKLEAQQSIDQSKTMGASSSSDKPSSSSSSSSSSQELQEQESLAASSGSLPFLRSAFTALSQSNPNSIPFSSLQNTFSLSPNPNPNPNSTPPHLPNLLSNLGPSIASLLFGPPDTSTNWLDFLTGYNKCCARMPASSSLNLLFKLYSESCNRAGIPCKLEFDSESDKVGGAFTPADLVTLLLICWVMERSWRVSGKEETAVLPDLTHLVMSALVSSGEISDDYEKVWEGNVLEIEKSVPAQKVQLWVMSSVPGLASCFSQYVQEKLKACAAGSSGDSVLSACDSSSSDVENALLLTCGRAWSISLTLRNTLREELSGASFPELVNEALDNILYRSSVHGKGLNRFWSNVEGYHGPILILISASYVDASLSERSTKRWVIGVLTEQGFENRETFYGNYGFLYAISPVFRVLSSSGKEKNFVYSHLHPTGRVYETNPKPVGLAFGGTLGSERIFVDEDFARVTVRHHAVDKTYQHGSLIPNQGFLPVEASVLEVEVWGFGGKAAKQQQDAFKKRETLFTEQRRKVDLKTFGNWEDSPEKMMMDMITDPNSVRREDR